MESLVYKADEVALMLKCSKSKAYNIISKINEMLVTKKIIKENSIIAGRVSKIEFDKIYK